jgi:hypothetical protein
MPEFLGGYEASVPQQSERIRLFRPQEGMKHKRV